MNLKIKIFIDSADKKILLSLRRNKLVKGFTTNPSLMRAAGVKIYAAFAKEILKEIKTLPISFEVIADEFKEMERQARILASWGKNVYIKIPITNTLGQSSFSLVKKLSRDGIKINITAVSNFSQIKKIAPAVMKNTPAIISIFAGRIADTGRNPELIIKRSSKFLKKYKNIELLWASYREFLNVFQAQKAGCQIITVKPEFMDKLDNLGKPLNQLSLEAVRQFYQDTKASNYKL